MSDLPWATFDDLEHKFQLAGEHYPGLMHVVVEWPGRDGLKGVQLDMKQLPQDLRYNDSNLVQFWDDWGYDLPAERVCDPRKHWLMRASDKRWNHRAALDNLSLLAADAFERLLWLMNDETVLFRLEAMYGIKKELADRPTVCSWLLGLYHLRMEPRSPFRDPPSMFFGKGIGLGTCS